MQTWSKKNQPKFKPHVKTTKFRVTGRVSTVAEVYRFVSEGTKGRFVAPKNGKVLRFKSGYKAKTSPGRIPSRSGGSFGSNAFSKGHRVSGIKARKFDKQVKEDTKDRFKMYMNQGLEDALLGG